MLELVIYVAVLAIVSLVIASMFVTINRGQGQVEVRAEVNSNSRFAIEKISQDLRAASAVTTPATAGATASNLVMTIAGSTIEYCLAANQLRRQVNGTCNASSETISSNRVIVNTPTFVRLENTNTVLAKTVVSVAVNLTVTSLDTTGEKIFSVNKKTAISIK